MWCVYIRLEQQTICLLLTPPMKMEHTECSETLAYKIWMPRNHPKERIEHSEHGESLKSIHTSCTADCCTWFVCTLLYVSATYCCLHQGATGCPTRYQTQHFFNNFTTNENIATKFEADLPHCVRNLKQKNVLLFKFLCSIFNGVRIIKEMSS
jgi:hypothetical protein